ncbi:MAG TPA: DNA polymerase III subunit delta [Stellaceae bacterium]|nr:DNA polymerase III subunit delta [Stellaceae bacterium]
MKLPPARVERFLDAPEPGMRAVLLFGPDAGLVRERADRLAAAIVPDRHDPFRVAELAAEALAADPARLNDEAQALSLVPGRRVVRVREAGDAVGALFDRFFAKLPPGDSLIVVEAGDLPARSSLRRAFEGARAAACIGCYADGRTELGALVRSVMGARRIAVTAEAMEYLVDHLGGDRLLSRQELDKLALYAGDGGRLDYDAASAIVGDSATITVEDAVFAAAEGDLAALERALGRAFDEGEAPVGVLRAGLRHFQRLHLAATRVAAGARPEEAIERLRPPVFFKLRERFLGQLRRWPAGRAAAALVTLTEAERNAKRAGLPPEAICRDALLRLARGAGGRRALREIG